MITVQIGDDQRSAEYVNEQWLTQQAARRKQNGQNICIKVTIRQGALDMVLATAGCTGGGGGRQANNLEMRVFDLWQKRGLNDADFSPGAIVAFLNQMKHSF